MVASEGELEVRKEEQKKLFVHPKIYEVWTYGPYEGNTGAQIISLTIIL